jgi:DNA-directed RNA polymerase specialized sigma24 family protein
MPNTHHTPAERVVTADAELIAALRRNDAGAWSAFHARFRPTLEAYANKTDIPRWEWPACITDVLADESLRLARRDAVVPRSLDAYLTRAVRNKYLYTKRAASCRDRNHLAASAHLAGEWFVPTTCSEDARRASAGPDGETLEISDGLQRLARDLSERMTAEERVILNWVGEGIPRRTIATWLGIGHEACAKRIWRLCRRLRAEAAERSKSYDARARREVDRLFSRANRSHAKRP